LADHNGKPGKSEGSDAQVVKFKKELTFAQKENAKLKNQLHQTKENIDREGAERGSKGKKEDFQDDEVGSKQPRQQGKQAKAPKPGLSPPTPPRKGFKRLPTVTGELSADGEEDYPEQNVTATYAKAKFARIRPIIQEQTVQMEIELKPVRVTVRAGQVMTSTHQRLIDLAIDSMEVDEYIGMPDLVADNEDQEKVSMVCQILRWRIIE
jgi:hypothetical protein